MANDTFYPPIADDKAPMALGSLWTPPEDDEAVPLLRRYFSVLLRLKWIVAAILLGSFALGFVSTILSTPIYTATSRLEISRQQKKITNVSGIDAESSVYDAEFYNTQYALLKTQALADRVARTLRLDRDVAFLAGHGIDADADGGQLSPQQRAARSKEARELLLDNVVISPIRGSSLVDIQYRSADAAQAARISNAWAAQFIEESVARRFASTADARRFLEQRLANLRERLEQSERDLVNYAGVNKIVLLASEETSDGKTRTVKTLATSNVEAINLELARATADRIAAESRASSTGTSRQFALSNSSAATLRARRAEVSADYQRMLIQFDPEYPGARELKAQIGQLDSEIRREEERVASTFDAQLQEARVRERAVQAKVDALQGRLDGERRASIQYSIYQREVDTNRELFDALLQRYKEIGVAGVEATNIAVVDAADIPESPTSPNLLLNLAIALIGGVLISGIVLFVMEHIDEGVRDPSVVPNEFGVPLLCTVQKMRKEENIIDELRDAKSRVAEAYTSARSMLALSTSHGLPHSLMVCSTAPGEGKSSSAIGLATAIARNGAKVVVVDADMRAPTLHKRFELGDGPGLSNYLAGEGPAARFCHESGTERLILLPAGPLPPNAADLLSGDGLSRLIAELLETFDHIIVDAPPTLGLADSLFIGRSVEGVVYIIEAQREPIRSIRASIKRMRSVNIRVLGAIVTKFDPRDAGLAYGYGYGYGYGYDYGSGKKDDEDGEDDDRNVFRRALSL